MSETVEQPQGEPAADPAVTTTTQATTESTAATEQTPEEQAEAERTSRGDRRFAELTAKLDASRRERERLVAEAEFYRRQVPAQQQPGGQETQEQAVERIRSEARAEAAAQIRTERFHEEGAAAHRDWKQRCDNLVEMGADPHLAQLLVEMAGGVKIAAALAEDPEAVQRIAGIRTERGRAIELGKYAASLDDTGTGRQAAPLTRAPAPIRPVTGRAAPTFNEYAADGQTLVERYMKQNIERQIRR